MSTKLSDEQQAEMELNRLSVPAEKIYVYENDTFLSETWDDRVMYTHLDIGQQLTRLELEPESGTLVVNKYTRQHHDQLFEIPLTEVSGAFALTRGAALTSLLERIGSLIDKVGKDATLYIRVFRKGEERETDGCVVYTTCEARTPTPTYETNRARPVQASSRTVTYYQAYVNIGIYKVTKAPRVPEHKTPTEALAAGLVGIVRDHFSGVMVLQPSDLCTLAETNTKIWAAEMAPGELCEYIVQPNPAHDGLDPREQESPEYAEWEAVRASDDGGRRAEIPFFHLNSSNSNRDEAWQAMAAWFAKLSKTASEATVILLSHEKAAAAAFRETRLPATITDGGRHVVSATLAVAMKSKGGKIVSFEPPVRSAFDEMTKLAVEDIRAAEDTSFQQALKQASKELSGHYELRRTLDGLYDWRIVSARDLDTRASGEYVIHHPVLERNAYYFVRAGGNLPLPVHDMPVAAEWFGVGPGVKTEIQFLAADTGYYPDLTIAQKAATDWLKNMAVAARAAYPKDRYELRLLLMDHISAGIHLSDCLFVTQREKYSPRESEYSITLTFAMYVVEKELPQPKTNAYPLGEAMARAFSQVTYLQTSDLQRSVAHDDLVYMMDIEPGGAVTYLTDLGRGSAMWNTVNGKRAEVPVKDIISTGADSPADALSNLLAALTQLAHRGARLLILAPDKQAAIKVAPHVDTWRAWICAGVHYPGPLQS